MKRSFSNAQANHAVDRLRAAVAFDQEVTLQPDEAYLITSVIDRLLYQRSKGSSK